MKFPSPPRFHGAGTLRTKAGGRLKQLRELLARIKDIDHPVIVAGDMNTTTEDSTPTSIRREIKKRLGSQVSG